MAKRLKQYTAFIELPNGITVPLPVWSSSKKAAREAATCHAATINGKVRMVLDLVPGP